MIDQDDMTGRQVHCKNKINMIKQWSPPPIRWKWNTSALELEPGITPIGIVCKDNNGHLLYSNGKSLGDCPILLTETLVIREDIMIAIQEKHLHVIIKSDSQLLFRLFPRCY